jgi:hypothetical protein
MSSASPCGSAGRVADAVSRTKAVTPFESVDGSLQRGVVDAARGGIAIARCAALLLQGGDFRDIAPVEARKLALQVSHGNTAVVETEGNGHDGVDQGASEAAPSLAGLPPCLAQPRVDVSAGAHGWRPVYASYVVNTTPSSSK